LILVHVVQTRVRMVAYANRVVTLPTNADVTVDLQDIIVKVMYCIRLNKPHISGNQNMIM